jgi:hypothetical protein
MKMLRRNEPKSSHRLACKTLKSNGLFQFPELIQAIETETCTQHTNHVYELFHTHLCVTGTQETLSLLVLTGITCARLFADYPPVN